MSQQTSTVTSPRRSPRLAGAPAVISEPTIANPDPPSGSALPENNPAPTLVDLVAENLANQNPLPRREPTEEHLEPERLLTQHRLRELQERERREMYIDTLQKRIDRVLATLQKGDPDATYKGEENDNYKRFCQSITQAAEGNNIPAHYVGDMMFKACTDEAKRYLNEKLTDDEHCLNDFSGQKCAEEIKKALASASFNSEEVMEQNYNELMALRLNGNPTPNNVEKFFQNSGICQGASAART